jgi:hypothetical protein
VPVAVLLAVLGAYAAGALLGNARDPAAAGILLAVYTVGAHGRGVRRAAVGVVGTLALAVTLAASLVAHAPPDPIAPGATLVALGLLGDSVRARRAHLAELRDRAAGEERARMPPATRPPPGPPDARRRPPCPARSPAPADARTSRAPVAPATATASPPPAAPGSRDNSPSPPG